MKYILLAFMLLASTFASGQEKIFTPTLSYFPSINPDSLAQFLQMKQDFNDLVEKRVTMDEHSSYHQFLMDNEILFYNDGFGTGVEGCSWYCAGGTSAIYATSTLASQGKNGYEAKNLHDFSIKTAWVEGKPGVGVGEELTFEFEMIEKIKVTTLKIYNGYCKSEKAWHNNGRVKTLELYVNEVYSGLLQLEDSYYCQEFVIGSYGCTDGEKMTIKLKITDVYKGDKYDDTAISEINFDGTGDH